MKINPDVKAFEFLRKQNNLEAAVSYLLPQKSYQDFFDDKRDYKEFRGEVAKYFVDTAKPCEKILEYFQKHKQQMHMMANAIHATLLRYIEDGAANNYSVTLLQHKVRRVEQVFHMQFQSPFRHGSQGFGYALTGKILAQYKRHQTKFKDLDEALAQNRYEDIAELYAIIKAAL